MRGPLLPTLGLLVVPLVNLYADAEKSAPSAAVPDALAWQPWSDAVFAQAKREHKFVLLDLEAVWCHWCHVMDHETYRDPKVIALLRAHYILVRVDQDSRPDLSNRYEDYGWPATVVFAADGGEIVKRQGDIPPREMSSMLQAIIDDPTPGPSVTNAKPIPTGDAHAPTDADTRALERQLAGGYDAKLGGWGFEHKFLDWDNTEYLLRRAQEGDAASEKMARQTLDAQLKLIDPVWGGVSQYSIGGDWDHPHFEKLLQFQAENIRIYSLAYRQLKDPAYLQAAQHIYNYVRAFLSSPDGVVYVSQDADLVPGQYAEDYFKLDDAARRKIGIPRVDRHIYARENGWFISALASLYAATGDSRYRDETIRAANWIIQNRALPDGGFRHDDANAGDNGPYLGDTLALGQAFLNLYAMTQDSAWRDRAAAALVYIQRHFGEPKRAGFATSQVSDQMPGFAPRPEFDENVALARFANLLSYYIGDTNDAPDKPIALEALKFCGTPAVYQRRGPFVGGLLLAERESREAPLHAVVVGSKSDPAAARLYLAVLAFPRAYKQTEWFDPADPATAAQRSIYPPLSQAAAFVCTATSCSNPLLDEAHLAARLNGR